DYYCYSTDSNDYHRVF
nr:immunoglobulin light chain junction region [Macaca mulatta]MOX33914.1 immunoglobulin light chain junction region [Macaca mulatta]MOX33950.1 immunoglobulin light chain junction region [Macaca mulatta]MOX34282.1 immunoglobulin light chain junction region [Macaca mulatta]MOX35183.1 immunoglobulin light chain junction region [Macaca mulatta]